MALILLAGGKSVRMGRDKARLMLPDGRSLLQFIYDRTSSEFEACYLAVGSREREEFPRAVGPESVFDELPSIGPVAGLHAGLRRSADDWNFVVACDMPGAGAEVAASLKTHLADALDAVVPSVEGRTQPLCGWYRKSCVKVIENNVSGHRHSMMALLDAARTRVVDLDSHFSADQLSRFFLNVNNPEDWRQFLAEESA